MKATDALGYFLCFWVMAGLVLLAGKTLAAELTVCAREAKGRGRIRGGNIYGRASAVKGRFENGKIHWRNWPGRSDRFWGPSWVMKRNFPKLFSCCNLIANLLKIRRMADSLRVR